MTKKIPTLLSRVAFATGNDNACGFSESENYDHLSTGLDPPNSPKSAVEGIAATGAVATKVENAPQSKDSTNVETGNVYGFLNTPNSYSGMFYQPHVAVKNDLMDTTQSPGF